MTEAKIKQWTYLMMTLTLGLIALGAIFPIGIASTYVGLGIPISVINVFLIHSFTPDHPTFKKWARGIYIFYGTLLIGFTLLFILLGVIFSFGF